MNEPEIDRREILRLTGAGTFGGAVGTAMNASGNRDGDRTNWTATDGSTNEASGKTVYGGKETLYAVDAETGEIQWTYDARTVDSSPTVVNGTIYVGTDAGLTAIDAVTGKEYWTAGFVSNVSLGGPTVVGGTVYVGADKALHAIDAVDCSSNWSFDVQFPSSGDTPSRFLTPNVVGEWIYAAEQNFDDREGALYRINAGTGEQDWRFDRFSLDPTTPPTVHEDMVFVGERDTQLIRLDATSGDSEQFYTQFEQAMRAAPVVEDLALPSGETTTVIAGSQDTPSDMYAFNVDDSIDPVGNFEEPGGDFWTAPTIGGDTSQSGEATLYTTNGNGTLYAASILGGSTGISKDWEFAIGGNPSAPTIRDGVVYVSGPNALYAVDAEDGTEDWSTEWDGPWFHAPTVVDEPAGGHSSGSRVQHGTIGHHHGFAGADPGEEPAAGSGTITGTVTDRHGDGLGDVEISLARVCCNQNDPDATCDPVPVGSVTTVADGTFTAEVPVETEATYVVTAADPLFEQVQDRIEVTVTADGSADVAIDMELVLVDDFEGKRDLLNRIESITYRVDERDGVEAAFDGIEDATRGGQLSVTEAENAVERLELGEEITDATMTVIGSWNQREGVDRPEVNLAKEFRNKAVFLGATNLLGIVVGKAKKLIPRDVFGKVSSNVFGFFDQLSDFLTILNKGLSRVDRLGTVPNDPTSILVEGGQVTYDLIRHGELQNPDNGEQVVGNVLDDLDYEAAIQWIAETGSVGLTTLPEGGARDGLADLNDAVESAGTETFQLDISQARTRRDDAIDNAYTKANSILNDLDPFSPSDVLSDVFGALIDIVTELQNLDDSGSQEVGTAAAPLLAAPVVIKAVIVAVKSIDTVISTLQAIDLAISLVHGKARMLEFPADHNAAVRDIGALEGS